MLMEATLQKLQYMICITRIWVNIHGQEPNLLVDQITLVIKEFFFRALIYEKIQANTLQLL
jgi:hypothetical protein